MITKKQFSLMTNYSLLGGLLVGILLKFIALFLPMDETFLPIRLLVLLLVLLLTAKKTKNLKVILLQNLLFGLFISLVCIRSLECLYEYDIMNSMGYALYCFSCIALYYIFTRKRYEI